MTINKRQNGCTAFLRSGVAVIFMLLAFHAPALAKSGRDTGDQFKMDINISGTVVVNGSCKFMTVTGTDVNFGEVRYSTISGATVLEGSYKKTLVDFLLCDGDIEGHPQLKLDTSDGASLSYQGAALLPIKTSSGSRMDSLGIRLLVNGKNQDVGQWFNIDVNSPPSLTAELVQTGNGDEFVDGDQFTANATMTLAFN